MEYVIIGVIVAAALACPVLMCGPMLLRRFVVTKSRGSDMSCMGITAPSRTSHESVNDLKAQRAGIGAEIARRRFDVEGALLVAGEALEHLAGGV